MEKVIQEIMIQLHEAKLKMRYLDDMQDEFELLHFKMIALEKLLLDAEKI